jgi:hypothetical protein
LESKISPNLPPKISPMTFQLEVRTNSVSR